MKKLKIKKEVVFTDRKGIGNKRYRKITHYSDGTTASYNYYRDKARYPAGYKVIWIHENFDENRRISPYDIFITTQSNKVFDSRYDEMIKKVLLKINEMYPNRIESNVINQCLENKYKLQNLYIASKEHKLWKKRYKSKLY